MTVRVCPRGHPIDEANSAPLRSRGRLYVICRRCRVEERARRTARGDDRRPDVVHGCGYCGVGSDRLADGICPDCTAVQAYIRQLDRYQLDPAYRAARAARKAERKAA